ncbi:MAG TPA: hypothetical protein VE988_08400 [Gemmataceae bacterium]|nr:hypothetical protein [Gemmataceae bacterium]
MITSTKAPSTTAAAKSNTRAAASPSLPWSLEERVRRIEAMGLRIDGYIKFMCQIPTLSSCSAEAKDRAVTAFYERMVVVERQLGSIHEEFRLE